MTYANTNGVIQIGCNGNDGSTTPSYPGSYPEVLSNGWTDLNDVRSPSSNHTTTIDVVAPGVSAPAPAYNTGADTYVLFSGCSAATPHSTGLASLLLAMDLTLTFDQAATIIESTADDQVGPPSQDVAGRDDYFGWGRINMERALQYLGLVSRSKVHVDDIAQQRISSTQHEIRVAVSDDLTGAEPGVAVSGTLTLPSSSTVVLTGTTASNGVATLTYQPGGSLPAGTFRFHVDSLSKAGFTYDAASNVETETTQDPALNGVHINAIDMTEDYASMTIDVQILDDEQMPEGGVTVQGTLSPPTGQSTSFTGTSRFAAGGVVRFIHHPTNLKTGTWSFQVTSASKSGFTYESGKNVETSDTHVV